jgi:hypothetical protein
MSTRSQSIDLRVDRKRRRKPCSLDVADDRAARPDLLGVLLEAERR